jgi:hypothetical protein
VQRLRAALLRGHDTFARARESLRVHWPLSAVGGAARRWCVRYGRY